MLSMLCIKKEKKKKKKDKKEGFEYSPPNDISSYLHILFHLYIKEK